MMEYDIHTILDGLSLVATLWVIYEMRFILKNTYQADQDTVQTYYVVSLCCTALEYGMHPKLLLGMILPFMHALSSLTGAQRVLSIKVSCIQPK